MARDIGAAGRVFFQPIEPVDEPQHIGHGDVGDGKIAGQPFATGQHRLQVLEARFEKCVQPFPARCVAGEAGKHENRPRQARRAGSEYPYWPRQVRREIVADVLDMMIRSCVQNGTRAVLPVTKPQTGCVHTFANGEPASTSPGHAVNENPAGNHKRKKVSTPPFPVVLPDGQPGPGCRLHAAHRTAFAATRA